MNRFSQCGPRVRCVVQNENTLGYIDPRQPHLLGVLGRNVHGHDPKDGPTYVDDNIRDATEKDFDTFRVCSKGYELSAK